MACWLATAATAHAQTVIYQDTFDNGSVAPTSVVRITGYTGPAPNNVTYSASAAWTSRCNGWVASWNSPANAPAANPQITDCGNALSWHAATNLVDILGMYNLGITVSSAASRNNIALTAFTSADPGNAAGNNIVIENTTPIAFPSLPAGGSGRFVTFRFTAAATSCSANHPLVTFSILNPTETQLGAQTDLCTGGLDARTLVSASHTDGANAARAATYYPAGTAANVLINGTALRFRVRNQQASGAGNDWAWDNFTVMDVSPTVTKTDPGIRYVGVAKPLTFTVTNTPQDNMRKVGWGFTDTLPAGVVVAATPSATTTCGAGTTITANAGADTITVANGNLAAGTAGGTASACTVTVNVVSNTAGIYTNAAANFTASTGLNLPPAPITMEWVLNRLTITKVTQGGTGTFGFSGNNGIANHDIATATPGTGVAGAQQTLTAGSVTANTTFTENVPSTVWVPTSVVCTGLAAGQTASLTGTTVTIPFAGLSLVTGGRSVACTLTNAVTRLTVTKVSNHGVGTFNFSGTNGFADQSITTLAAGTGVAGAPQVLSAPNVAMTITEAAPPAGFALQSITCSGLGAGGTFTPTINGVNGGNVVLNAAATAPGSDIQCTFTNIAKASLQLAKAWAANSVAGHSVTIGATTGGSTNTAAFNATAPNAANSGAAVPVNIGEVITLPAETGVDAANYTTGLVCSGGHTLSGSNGQQTNTLTITSANPAVCTYTNTLRTADLSISKTNTPAAGRADQANDTLVAGASTTYTLVVSNHGAEPITGALVRDTPQAGLDCPAAGAVTCAPAAACPSAGITVADLGSGVTLGTLAGGAEATLSFVCAVRP